MGEIRFGGREFARMYIHISTFIRWQWAIFHGALKFIKFSFIKVFRRHHRYFCIMEGSGSENMSRMEKWLNGEDFTGMPQLDATLKLCLNSNMEMLAGRTMSFQIYEVVFLFCASCKLLKALLWDYISHYFLFLRRNWSA